MACIASSFTGSVAALKASKVQVRTRACYCARRARARAFSDVFFFGNPAPFLRSRHLFATRSYAVSNLPDPHPPPFQAKSVSTMIKADIYPEFGTYPGGGESPIIPFGSEKNAEREVIHGRWAMLGVTGAWAAENGTGIPWFTAGTLCTPDDCTAVADKFPGAVAPLAPEGSGYPSFWAVLALEIFLVGSAECYRTGLFENPFPELELSVTPGGRFDPLGFAEAGDLEELKVKELKHCRLSMFAWLGCIMQALATQEGPIANWQAHVADPVHANVLTNAASGFGFY